MGSISFLHGSHSFAELMYNGFVKPVQVDAYTGSIAAATWLHIWPMPAVQVQSHNRILANFLKIIQSLWKGSLTN